MAGQMLYKLEYFQGWKSSSDPGVFIHLKVNPPTFKKFTPIEDVTADDHAFVKALAQVPGVTDIYLSAYRVFVQKAPSFRWDEVIVQVLNLTQSTLGFTSRAEIEPPVGGTSTGVDANVGTTYGTKPLEDKKDRRDWPI